MRRVHHDIDARTPSADDVGSSKPMPACSRRVDAEGDPTAARHHVRRHPRQRHAPSRVEGIKINRGTKSRADVREDVSPWRAPRRNQRSTAATGLDCRLASTPTTRRASRGVKNDGQLGKIRSSRRRGSDHPRRRQGRHHRRHRGAAALSGATRHAEMAKYLEGVRASFRRTSDNRAHKSSKILTRCLLGPRREQQGKSCHNGWCRWSRRGVMIAPPYRFIGTMSGAAAAVAAPSSSSGHRQDISGGSSPCPASAVGRAEWVTPGRRNGR